MGQTWARSFDQNETQCLLTRWGMVLVCGESHHSRSPLKTSGNIVWVERPGFGMASKQSPTLFRNRIRLFSQAGVLILIKTRSLLYQTWGRNFDQNEIPFWIRLGIRIWINMRSRFESNFGSGILSKWDPVLDQTLGQTFDQNEIQFGIKLGVKILDRNEISLYIQLGVRVLVRMRSHFGSN